MLVGQHARSRSGKAHAGLKNCSAGKWETAHGIHAGVDPAVPSAPAGKEVSKLIMSMRGDHDI